MLCSCAGIQRYQTAKVEKYSVPAINQKVAIPLGSDLLVQGIRSTRRVLEITEAVDVSIFSLNPNTYIKTGSLGDKDFYESINGVSPFSYSKRAGLLISEEKNIACVCDIPTGISVEVTDCSSLGSVLLHGKFLNKTFVDDSSFQQTLIYTGKVGNRIRFSYREFSGDRARSEFTTDVEYDLNEGNVISYQGATIEIISADNREITYIIRSNFRDYK